MTILQTIHTLNKEEDTLLSESIFKHYTIWNAIEEGRLHYISKYNLISQRINLITTNLLNEFKQDINQLQYFIRRTEEFMNKKPKERIYAFKWVSNDKELLIYISQNSHTYKIGKNRLKHYTIMKAEDY